ncbi:MFS transporter [Chengkuizengella axinellae]|uniref:MFS transporter n=1 Tax=Chengkuizengella axinellae TaxID=3064388 RepID=A0ABT9J1G7_9BACL|nr:MFS transporter [Chengkuizengella sp. 2205SS18-9]MDP5274860.1 MFS transporter [Chengkuizengella sp. 2205SS18-9]
MKFIPKLNFFSPIFILIFGSFLVGAANSAMIPFLSIFLSRNSNLSLSEIGIIVGISPFMGIFGGIIGGYLADRYGKKEIMLITLLVTIVSTIGLTLTTHFWVLIMINAICGFSRIAFNPVARSILTDLVKSEIRMKILSYDQTAFNSGYVLGMLLGSLLIELNSPAPLYFTATMTGILFLLIFFCIQKPAGFARTFSTLDVKEKLGLGQSFALIYRDRVLLWITLGGILFNMAFFQLTTTFPIFMEYNWESNGIRLYSFLIIINTIMVIGLQIKLTKVLENRNPYILLTIASLFGALAYTIFQIESIWIYVIAIIVLTFGELISFIGVQQSTLDLSSEQTKSTYFGFRSVTSLGISLGPAFGMFLLDNYSAAIMLIICSLVFLISAGCYMVAYQTRNVRKIEMEVIV